ncbi:MAG: hypothetical protein V3S27_02220 [Kiloniellales bacterium]
MTVGTGSTSMTREDVAIHLELFVAGIVILSCLAAAFCEGKQAALDILARCLVVRDGHEVRAPGGRRKNCARRAPGASPGAQQVG